MPKYNSIQEELKEFAMKRCAETYTNGFTLKAYKEITKNDMINMCKFLEDQYSHSCDCEFQPEPINEGGILYKFKNNLVDDKLLKPYKSVRLCVSGMWSQKSWPIVSKNYLSEWTGSNDIILDKNDKITLFLKSFYGAPVFTLEELKIWEECFNQIGLKKVGKYPTKKSLITYDRLSAYKHY